MRPDTFRPTFLAALSAPAIALSTANKARDVPFPEGQLEKAEYLNEGEDGRSLIDLELGSGCSNKRTRVEWGSMPDSDRRSFVDAIQCLMDAPPIGSSNATSRYDELVWVHSSMYLSVHGDGLFLPWHRYFVHGFESLLRSECGYEAAFPWWYEIQDSGNFAGSDLFTPDYFGTLPVDDSPPSEPASGFCVAAGVFANRTLSIGVDKPTCLKRGERKYISNMVTLQLLNQCQTNATTFLKYATCVNNGIHVKTHAAIGPIMSSIPVSVNDPVFFMHHGFVDWEWRRWQRVDESRNEAISGCAVLPGDNECTPITLDTVLSSKGVLPNMTVRDVMDTNNSPLCYEYDFY